MFEGLGHDAIVCGDDEHADFDSGGSGDHGLDELFVAGDIDDAKADTGEVEVGEPEFDGEPAGLFLGESIGVDAGEGFDE